MGFFGIIPREKTSAPVFKEVEIIKANGVIITTPPNNNSVHIIILEGFIGEITSGIYSPRLKTNIGLSMIQSGHWDIGREVIVRSDNNEFHNGVISSLPFN